MSKRIKPCPFCGGKAVILYQDHNTLGIAFCRDCNVKFIFPQWVDIEKAWNTRGGDGAVEVDSVK